MRNAGPPFYCIGQLLVCLGHLQITVAEHGIAGRIGFIASAPSFSSTAFALLTHCGADRGGS
jgi:hypothetical protein